MTLTWKIMSLEQVPSEGSLSKVCKKIDWMIKGEEDTNSTYQYGKVTLNNADSGNFIDFDSLTEANCIAWAKDVLGTTKVNELETEVTNSLKELKDGTKSNSNLPW